MKNTGMRWARFALVMLLVLALAACGSSGKPKETEQKADFAPKLDTNTSCSIRVAGHYNNFEALEAEFNRFNQYYPNVELSYTYLDNYKKTIVSALGSEEAPDVFFVYPQMPTQPEYSALFEAAEDLSAESLGIDLSCIREAILYKDAEGHVPYVPVYSSTYGMLVNEEIFEKEKIAIPGTYTELIAACEALQKAGYASPIMGHPSMLVYPLYFPYFCGQIMGKDDVLSQLNALDPTAGEYMRGAMELAADFMGRGFVDQELCAQLENDYEAVILRFFEGDVPMMLASSGTVSGTEKRQSMSEAFTAHPFRYSFYPVPSTDQGGYFLETISMGFAVNKNSANLDMTNEFMRFLVSTSELNQMAQMKRMVSPCNDMSLDGVYAAFGKVPSDHIINLSRLGLGDEADTQVRKAGRKVSSGQLTVDEAVAAFGTLED